MAYTLPNFNILASVYSGGLPPPTNPPRLVSPAGMTLGLRKTNQSARNVLTQGAATTGSSMLLLTPKGTDIRAEWDGGAADVVELGTASSRFYRVLAVDDSGYGFANEFRVAWIEQVVNPLTMFGIPFPIPLPPGGGTPPPPSSNLVTNTPGGLLFTWGTWTTGFQFAVSTAPMIVTALGRYTTTGDSNTHIIGLYSAGSTLMASVLVDASLGTPGTYQFTPLGSPLTLLPGVVYNLGDTDPAGADQFHHQVLMTSTAAATIIDQIYTTTSPPSAGNPFLLAGIPGNNAGGVPNLQYHL